MQQAEPASSRQKDDQRLLGLIKQSWLESGGVYGYRKIAHDLRDLGERCGKHRVYRLMKQYGLRAQVCYRRRASHYGKPAVVAENGLEQNFDVEAPNQVCVTDITYIRIHEGWLYLAAVLDLFSCQVIGWSMRSWIDSEMAINALLMAIWRRNPKAPITAHSEQVCQYSSRDWQAFLNAHGLVTSMNLRGNCYDNAVAENFFQLLKREHIRRKAYLDREEARRDGINYIEMLYNSKPRHGYANNVSPVEFENQHFNWLQHV